MAGTTPGWSPNQSESPAPEPPAFDRGSGAGEVVRRATLNDPRLQRLRDLIRDVVRLQERTRQLITEVTRQLRPDIIRARTALRDRRRRPR